MYFTLIITSVLFVETSFPVFHVVLEFSAIPCAILIKVLADSILDVIFPVSDVELSFDVVVFALSVFDSRLKLAFVTLPVLIEHRAPTIWLSIFDLSFVNCPIWPMQCLNVFVFGLIRLLLGYFWFYQILWFFFFHRYLFI